MDVSSLERRVLKAYMIKAFTMDDERLTSPDYFDELLERIRQIRASEKRFCQKECDLMMLSSDYDKRQIYSDVLRRNAK